MRKEGLRFTSPFIAAGVLILTSLLTACGDGASLFGSNDSASTPVSFDSLDEEVRGQFTKIVDIDPGKEVTLEVTAFRFKSDVSMSLNNLIQVGFEPHTDGAVRLSDSLIEFTDGFTAVVKLLDKKRCGKFVLDILNILLCPGSMSFAGFADGSSFGLRAAGGKNPAESDFYDLSFSVYKSKTDFEKLEDSVASTGVFEPAEESETKVEETAGGKTAKDTVASGQTPTPTPTTTVVPHSAIVSLIPGVSIDLGTTYGHTIDMAFLGKNSLISKNNFNVAVSASAGPAGPDEDTLHLISVQNGVPTKTHSTVIDSFGAISGPFQALSIASNDLGDKIVVHSKTDEPSGDAFNFLALEITNGGNNIGVDPLMFTGGTSSAYALSTFSYIPNDDRAAVKDMIYTSSGVTAFGYADRNDGNANKYKLWFTVDKEDNYSSITQLPDSLSGLAFFTTLVTYFSGTEPKKFENNVARMFFDGIGDNRVDFSISSCSFTTGACIHKTLLEKDITSTEGGVSVFAADATEIVHHPGTYNSLYIVEYSANPIRNHSIILVQTIISDFTTNETLSVHSKATYALPEGDSVEKGVISPTGDYVLLVIKHDPGTREFQVIKVNR